MRLYNLLLPLLRNLDNDTIEKQTFYFNMDSSIENFYNRIRIITPVSLHHKIPVPQSSTQITIKK
jgi:hypothetical protein